MEFEPPLQPDCVVSGVLSFVLHVSRIACMAPVDFERVRGGWRMSISRLYFVYACLLIIILQIFAGFASFGDRDDIVDGYEPSANTRFMDVYTKLIIIVQATVAITVMYTGYNRLRHMIDCLAQLEQINKKIDRIFRPLSVTERKTWILVIFLILHGYIGSFMEYIMYLYDVTTANKTVPFISLTMLSAYINLIQLQLFPIQFFLVTMRLVSAQERLNNSLRRLLQEIYQERLIPIPQYILSKNTIPTNIHHPEFNYNLYSRTASIVNEGSSEGDYKLNAELLNHLANIYCSLCGVVRQLNDSNGISLVMLLLFVVRNFITMPYLVVSILYRNHATFPVAKSLCSVAWSSVCLAMLVLTVEPCHRVHNQLYLTKSLIHQMIRHNPDRTSAVNYELKMFKRHILLNPVSFRPMQLLKFDRYILVVVFTTVVKYLSVFINL